MNKMMMEYNKKLAQEKKDREAKNKYDQTMMDVFSIEEAERTRSTVYSKLKDEINQTKSSIS